MTRLQLAGAAMAVIAVASLGACTQPAPAKPAADTGKIADAVKADVTQLMTDYNAHDATKSASHMASDGVSMFHGAPNTVGPAAVEAAEKQGFTADPTLKVTLADQTVDVAASGDMAVFHSTYVATFTDPKTKKAGTDKGNFLAGYKQQADGSWKQEWSVVENTDPLPAPAPAAKS